MIETLKKLLEEALSRLYNQISTYLPSLLAAVTLILGAYVIALLARWFIYKIFKGLAIDKFLRESGVLYIIAPSGRLHATRIMAESAYWFILLSGFLLGVDVFGTDLSMRITRDIVFLLPKVLEAGAILLAGMWLGQYLGRSALVWAVNENLASPHRLATVVRVLVTFASVVIAADQLQFAKSVFLAAFVIFVGGLVFTVSLSIGLGNKGVRRLFEEEKEQPAESATARSLWNHL